MNRAQFIGGVICLAVAALLAVLNIVLPPGEMVFMMGDANLPWIPPAILAVVGLILVVLSKGQADEVAAEGATVEEAVIDPAKAALNKRMESIAWGLFLIMLGGFMFVPDTVIADGFWSIGVGLIMLGLNGARYLNQMKMSGFTTLLGMIALVGGILQLMGVQGIEGALLLMILGAYLIVKPWFEQRQLFGKAEERHA